MLGYLVLRSEFRFLFLDEKTCSFMWLLCFFAVFADFPVVGGLVPVLLSWLLSLLLIWLLLLRRCVLLLLLLLLLMLIPLALLL